MFKSVFTNRQTTFLKVTNFQKGIQSKADMLFFKNPLMSVFNLLLFTFFVLNLNAQNPLPKPPDSLKALDLQQVTVTATMATAATPMTFTNLSKDQIRRADFGQDMPFLLKTTPSVVETSDAGDRLRQMPYSCGPTT